MIVKLFVKLLLGKKDSFARLIRLKGKCYLIEIEQFKPASEFIKELQEKML